MYGSVHSFTAQGTNHSGLVSFPLVRAYTAYIKLLFSGVIGIRFIDVVVELYAGTPDYIMAMDLSIHEFLREGRLVPRCWSNRALASTTLVLLKPRY